MTSQAMPPKNRRPHVAVAVVHLFFSWLLVAVLAVDLITSPLHAHRHDGDGSAGGTLAASPARVNDQFSTGSASVLIHVEHDEVLGFSHSISALRSSTEVTASVPPSDEPTAARHWFVPSLWPPVGAAALVWPPDRHRAGPSAFKSLPPHGRAPPLHT
jgi:hypothetical protein